MFKEACRKYEKRLFAKDQYGIARFCGVNQHDIYCCSIEQAASLTVAINKALQFGMFSHTGHGSAHSVG